MTTFADPGHCPDCRGAITSADAACPRCALTLRGETAQRLFVVLSEADRLLGELRLQRPAPRRAAAAGATPAATSPGAITHRPYPAAAPLAPTDRVRRGLSARSVPVILLTLGAGCLVIAALVFLAVTWTLLGVAGRTTVLVVLTALAGVLAGRMVRSRLRGAAEALSTVGYGLLTLDLLGAHHAGWLGQPSTAGLVLVIGLALGVAGAAGALAAGRASVELAGAQAVTLLGTTLVGGALVAGPWLPTAPALVLAVLITGLVAAAARASRLGVLAVGAGLVTAGWWLALAADGLGRVVEHGDAFGALWGGLRVWPLLVAAALVATPTAARRLPVALRVGSAAVAHTLLAVAALAPAVAPALTGADVTGPVLVGLGVLAATAGVAGLLPRPWGLANALTALLAALLSLTAVAVLVHDAVERLAGTADAGWTGHGTDVLAATPTTAATVPAPWLLPLAVVAALAAVAGFGRALPTAAGVRLPRGGARVATLAAVVGVAAAALVLMLALYPVPVALEMAALLLVVLASLAWWLGSGSLATLALGVPFGAGALLVSLHAEALTGACLAAALGHAVAVQLRARRSELAVTAAAWSALLVGASVWTWGAVTDAAPAWTALLGLGLLAALVLVAPYLPDGGWRSRATDVRTGFEAGAAATAAALGTAAVAAVSTSSEATWAAVYLTLAGATVTVMSLLRPDRRLLGWVGGVLLAAASWVRLHDLGVHAPEAYTLPSAAVLVVVGLLHLRRDRSAATTTALLPGLSLATVPSLLWVLADPTGWRPLLVGLAALALVLAGTALRWTAPLVAGAVVGALLVLRLVAPYEHAVPRWILIGGAGALLVLIGATWERRLAEARQLAGYVRRLR